MRTEEMNKMALSMALYRTAMFFERDKRNHYRKSDIDWLIKYLDAHGTRSKPQFEDGIDPMISWTLTDNSFFALGNPKQDLYPCQFYALEEGWE